MQNNKYKEDIGEYRHNIPILLGVQQNLNAQ